MITFFRRARQQLLANNRFSKYLLYAIGEIVLVVIGILVALSVNNWNLRRIDQKKELQLIEKFQNQNALNLEKIQNEMIFYTYVEATSDSILKIFQRKKMQVSAEDVTALMGVLTFDYHLNLDITAIAEATENGTLSLLENNELRGSIYDFKNANELFRQREKIINDDLQNHFIDYFYTSYNFAQFLPGYAYLLSESTRAETAALGNQLYFKNYIVVRQLYLDELMASIASLQSKLDELQELLERERIRLRN